MAKIVDLEAAKTIGKSFLMQSRTKAIDKVIDEGNDKKDADLKLVLRVDSVNTSYDTIEKNKDALEKNIKLKDEGEACFYVFNSDSGGFVIISAEDDNEDRILGYSLSGHFDINNFPPVLADFFEGYRRDILKKREENSSQPAISPRKAPTNVPDVDVVVAPLIKTTWGQEIYYNYYAPFYYPSGCTSVAMAQIIKYYEWPKKGKGTNTYDDSSTPCWNFEYRDKNCPGLTYKGRDVTADFGNTEYDKYYDMMPASLPRSDDENKYIGRKELNDVKPLNPVPPDIKSVAMLIRHCALAVNMDYWMSGSHVDLGMGGGIGNISYVMGLDGLYKHFKYNKANTSYKATVTNDSGWNKKLRDSLDKGYVVPYYAAMAHVFICDGYAKGDLFHFNFGWRGNQNGYYKFGGLHVDGINYDILPYASFDLKPDTDICFLDVQCGIKSLIPLEPAAYDLSSFVIFPYGKVPVAKGYSRKFKLYDSKSAAGNVYEIDCIDYNGTKYAFNNNNPEFTANDVRNNGTIEVLVKPIYNFEVGGVEYKALSYDTAAVISVKPENLNVVIPETVNYNGQTFKVMEIKQGAFNSNKTVKTFKADYVTKIEDDLLKDASVLETVSVKKVNTIGSYAFYNCRNLQEIVMDNAENIWDYAFYGCIRLSMKPGALNSIRNIGKCAFEGCEKLNIDVNNTYLRSVEANVFKNTNIKSAVFLNVLDIQEYAFSNCKSLINVNIPNVTEKIGIRAFENCTGLADVIAGNVKEIRESAFSNCSKLNNINLEKVEYIRKQAFENCTGLPKVIAGSVKEIRENAFSNCSKLDNISMEKVGYIGKQAFENCTGLTKVIAGNVKEIRESAFFNCSKLNNINMERVEYIGKQAFENCTVLANIGNMRHVKEIAESSFKNTQISSITFPYSLQSIGSMAFSGCVQIRKIECFADNPPICTINSFDGVDKSIPVYVPFDKEGEYKKAIGWKDFTNYCRTEIIEKGIRYRIDTSNTASVIGVQRGYFPVTVDDNDDGVVFSINSGVPIFPEPKADIKGTVEYAGSIFKVVAIKEKAFLNEKGIKYVSIGIRNPEGEYSIEANAFEGCIGIKAILCQSREPYKVPDIDVFKGLYKTVESSVKLLEHVGLYVSSDCIESYQNADVWKEFNIIGYIDNREIGIPKIPPLLKRKNFYIKIPPLAMRKKYFRIICDILDISTVIRFQDLAALITKYPVEMVEMFRDTIITSEINITIPKKIESRYEGFLRVESALIKQGAEALKIIETFAHEDVNVIKEAFAKNVNVNMNVEIAERPALNMTKSVSLKQEIEDDSDYGTYFEQLDYNLQTLEKMLNLQRKRYFVSKAAQKGGEREMHVEGCKFMRAEENIIELGTFISEEDALSEAQKHYTNANGCYYCCKATDTDKLKLKEKK